ncbi:O-antigen ligase family protein [Arsenicicoccus sp. UBA7492]|uniref:O-antigen ligase family protein n=1 Tax=Arsenicicoccus sp. UBA7492 TaxID=1946057 RepID=UPI00257A5C1B|nr:O-antigen ligase family protein [Arsenicicoccus sp. UBA7492]
MTRALAHAMGALGGFGLIVLIRDQTHRLRWLIYGLAIAAGVVGVIALFEYVTGIHLPQRADRAWVFGNALGATFNNPNNFAAHISLMIGALVGVGARHPLARVPVAAIVGTLLLANVMTYSRTAWFTLALCLVVIAVVTSAGRISRMIPKLILFGTIPAVLWLVMGGMSSEYSQKVLSGSGQSNLLRIELVLQALGVLIDSLGVGIGPGRIEEMTLHTSLGLAGVSDVHNSILEMGVAYGLIPAVVLVYIMLGGAKACLKGAKRNRMFTAAGLGAASSLTLGAFVASSVVGEAAWWLALGATALAADAIAGGVDES